MNKKVLIIGPSPYKSKGGMATVIQEMQESEILNNGFDLEIHESYRDGNIFYRLLFSIYKFIKFLFIYKKYDIFHIHMASYGSTFRKGLYIDVLKNKNKNIILHIHGAEYLVFYEKLSENKKLRVQNIWKKADKIIVLSEQWKQDFFKIFNLKSFVVINNGINIKKLKLANSKVKECRNNFLFLGRIGKRKGAYDLIEAMENIIKKFPKIKLYMAGDGEVEEIKKLIQNKNLGENIVVVGWVNFDKKIDLLNKVATVVLPSYNEGLPMTILEGMAAGKVIISSKVGAIPEVISSDNGILIDAGNITELSKAIIDILEMSDQNLSIISKKNIEKIEKNFSMAMMHEQLKIIYKSQGEYDDKLL